MITIVYTFLGGVWALMVTDYIQFLMKTMALLLLVPLAVWRLAACIMRSHRCRRDSCVSRTGRTTGFICRLGRDAHNHIERLVVIGAKILFGEERPELSKAAYFSAFLHLIGGPVMILPAILARGFLPDLIAPT